MAKISVQMTAYRDDDKTIIVVTSDNAQVVMKYGDGGQDELATVVENLKEIVTYMIDDYLVRQKFTDQLENDLDTWLDNN